MHLNFETEIYTSNQPKIISTKRNFLPKSMTFIKESNLKHISKTRQVKQKLKNIYLENRLIKHGYPKETTILLKHL